MVVLPSSNVGSLTQESEDSQALVYTAGRDRFIKLWQVNYNSKKVTQCVHCCRVSSSLISTNTQTGLTKSFSFLRTNSVRIDC